jgi:beta-carotene/zeaxanthin 4-ketolase
MGERRQMAIGLGLGAAIGGAWLLLHFYSVFLHAPTGEGLLLAPLLVAALCWLNVGLFIVAHDAMHGSLAPGRPKTNLWVGRIALSLYAGFSFDRLRAKHFEHHRRPGTAADPDFSVTHRRRFWPWYAAFLRRYFGLREAGILTLLVAAYLLLLSASYANLLLFWALPAILSSLQLFLFGTFLPHREDEAGFADRHRARSNDYGYLASLMSCFHFGYHHEHHLAPQLPWWRLPQERTRRRDKAPSR